MLAEGKVACLTVAGGQGSRLGWDGPKGTFPSGLITGDSLFAQFAGQIDRETKRYGKAVPWCIMTSPLNHESTVAFFEQHHHFGLDPSTVHFFTQGVMPSVDCETGEVLLAAPDAIAFNPDGHGGTLRALAGSGLLSTLRRQDIEHLSYSKSTILWSGHWTRSLGLHIGRRFKRRSDQQGRRQTFRRREGWCLRGSRWSVDGFGILRSQPGGV